VEIFTSASQLGLQHPFLFGDLQSIMPGNVQFPTKTDERRGIWTPMIHHTRIIDMQELKGSTGACETLSKQDERRPWLHGNHQGGYTVIKLYHFPLQDSSIIWPIVALCCPGAEVQKDSVSSSRLSRAVVQPLEDAFHPSQYSELFPIFPVLRAL
jgi:hypothetical protein